jgi:hypothetical protein
LSLKSEAVVFRKSAHPPSYASPFKIPHHLVQLLAIRFLISNGAEQIHSAVGKGKYVVYSHWLQGPENTFLVTEEE